MDRHFFHLCLALLTLILILSGFLVVSAVEPVHATIPTVHTNPVLPPAGLSPHPASSLDIDRTGADNPQDSTLLSGNKTNTSPSPQKDLSSSVLTYLDYSRGVLNNTRAGGNIRSERLGNQSVGKQGGVTILEPLYPGGNGYICHCYEDINNPGHCNNNNPNEYTIFSPGYYILGSGFNNNNWRFLGIEKIIEISSPDVTFDGNNQIITGLYGGGIYINSNSRNATIKNSGGLKNDGGRYIFSEASNVTIIGNSFLPDNEWWYTFEIISKGSDANIVDNSNIYT